MAIARGGGEAPPSKWHESAKEGVFVAIARGGLEAPDAPPSKWHESAKEGVSVAIARGGGEAPDAPPSKWAVVDSWTRRLALRTYVRVQ